MESSSEAVVASNPSFVSSVSSVSSNNGNGNGFNVPAPYLVPGATATDPSAPRSSFSSPTITTTTASVNANANATITATTTNVKKKNNNSSSSSSSTPSKHTIFHAHRQSHNSSKLPAYRFADLQKEPISLPSLLQTQHPPTPVSPDPDQHTETQPNTAQESTPPTAHKHQNKNNSNNTASTVSPEKPAAVHVGIDKSSPTRFRASTSTIQTPATLSTATTTSSTTNTNAKRSASLDSSTATKNRIPTHSIDTTVAVRPSHRRAPLSASSINNDTTSNRRMHVSDDSQSALSGEEISREWTHGQRELLLPKTIQRTATTDEKRSSLARRPRPPVSYKPPVTSSASGGTASIPPIRSFRSSGERRSLVLDMNIRSARTYEGDDYGDSNHRDRTLRALEGRRFDDASQLTPPDSAGDRPDGDDSGDLFLKIAREDPSRRGTDGNGNYGDNQSAISRVTRISRRPLSMGVSSHQPTSPPQVARRMSDQETSRPRGFGDDQSQSGERIARTMTYRGSSRDRPSDETRPKGNMTPLRASPLTPRFQDVPSDQGSSYNRRRQMSIDNGTPVPSRMTSLKQNNINYSHPRTYNSSPLVPRTTEPQKYEVHPEETNHGIEGTNSTASTAAPSTVWDELDDLKSRIHRLELTGKLPPTSGAAISRASEERPPTANTNATTLSASPKRGSGSAAQVPDANSSIQRDAHPLLHSALVKSKGFLSAEVFEALEATANDALSLSLMMGIAGQPGPIASGASSIGSGTTLTDRQLRRKADSICRSLTELCLALSEGAAQNKPQEVIAPAPENPPMSTLASPTITKFPGVASQRRPSAVDRTLTVTTSPRALSRYEDRRGIPLLSTELPTSRYSSTNPSTPTDAAAAAAATGRKTSMLMSRTRRAGTEEPEEGRKSSLLRTRRATTEEPEDRSERKPILTRGRRGTIGNEDEEIRFRAPSRAITEVQGARSGAREYTSQFTPLPSKEQESLASSALPRRRLGSVLGTRLVLPSTTASLATPTRRYFDRSTPERETYNPGDRSGEERPQRAFSLARNGSMDKRANRGNMITTSSPATGGYR